MPRDTGPQPNHDAEPSERPTVETIEDGAGAVISGVDDARLADIGVALYEKLGGVELSPEERVLMLHAGEPLRPNGMWIQLMDGQLKVSAWENRRGEKEMRERVQQAVREVVG
jgi:hypothetical protein